MTREYNELVGIQARFSKVIQRYSLTHLYRWRNNGVTSATGSMRGYDMHMHLPASEIRRDLRSAYAPAILSVWRQETPAVFTEYLQLEPGFTPEDLDLQGDWEHWAEK